MAQGEGFKHITVTAADEDDVLIVAGVAREDDSEPEEPVGAPEDSPVEPVGASSSSPAGDEASASVGASSSSPAGDEASASVGASSSSPAPAGRTSRPAGGPARKGDYREPTLEDLEGKPMPFAQKATIIVAIVLIVVAVAYYFVAMA